MRFQAVTCHHDDARLTHQERLGSRILKTIMEEVEQNDFSFTGDVEGLCTFGVSSCIAVAIINRTSLEIGLLHASGMSACNILEDFIHAAGSFRTPEQHVEIYIRGGDASDRSHMKHVMNDRQFVVDELKKAFPAATFDIKWLAPNSIVDLTVRPGSPNFSEN